MVMMMNDTLLGSGMLTMMNGAKARMLACEKARQYLWQGETDGNEDFYAMDKKLDVKEAYYRGQLEGLTALWQRMNEEAPVLTAEYDRLLYNRLTDKIALIIGMNAKEG